MPIQITVPRLGWSMEEATFSAWLKQDGDAVSPGEPLFTLENEKATQDVDAIDRGILCIPPGAPKPGDTVRVGQLLAHLLAAGECAPAQAGATVAPPAPIQPARAASGAPGVSAPAQTVGTEPEGHPAMPAVGRTISPRALRVAAELGVDWTQVQGTGRTGRIREQDIRAAAAGSSRRPLPPDPATTH